MNKRHSEEEKRQADMIDQFVAEALVYKIGSMFPNLSEEQVARMAPIVQRDMRRMKTADALDHKLREFDLGTDRAAAVQRIETCGEDIACAVVGLGCDIEEGIHQIRWRDERPPPRTRRRSSNAARHSSH